MQNFSNNKHSQTWWFWFQWFQCWVCLVFSCRDLEPARHLLVLAYVSKSVSYHFPKHHVYFQWSAWNMMNNACNTFFFFRSFDVLEITLQDPRLPNPDPSRLCIHHSTCCMASWCIALCYVTARNIINKWIEGTMDTALEHGKLPRHPACPCVVLPICNFEHITYVASNQRAWRKDMICWVSVSFDFPFFTSQFDFVYASSIFRFLLNQICFENKLSGKNNFLVFGRPNNQTLNPMVNEVRSNAGRSWSWKTASQIWFET